MKINKNQIDEQFTGILTTKKVNEIIEKQNLNLKLTKDEHIWFDRQFGVRRSNIKFAHTKKELEEYAKCKMDIHYFADNYCHIKREDGTIGPMKLRDYQKDILDLYANNRYSILMTSRQLGKTISAAILILHYCLFNKDKGVMIVANKGATVVEIIEKIKSIYKLLPFFLKIGIVNWNQSSITFDNGCRIKTDKRTKEPAIGFTIDLLYLDEFAHIPNNIVEPYYTAVVPIVSSINNSKIIITSTPKGLNLFHKLLVDSELPEDDPNWNGYRSLRVYWWQMKNRRDTKIFVNDKKLRKFKITKEQLRKFLIENGYNIYSSKENRLDGLFVEHDRKNDETNIDFIRSLRIKDLPLAELGVVTNWQEQQTKLIGGEDAFKQEFDLHFITGNKMLFDNVTLEKIIEDKLKFEYIDIDKFNKKLRIPYNGLQFIKNDELFNLNECKNYHIGISIDLGEGLGNDYSIINIFRLLPKTKDEIEIHKKKFTDKYDYFKLEQIGIFKSNVFSVKEISDILYMIVFELFDENKVKIALERNTYGDELLAHMPHVFNDNNNYSNHVFLRYRHRIEDKTTKLGIKITQNKKLLIKDYQINTKKGNIIIHDQYTINEISTFTKHELASGDITFKSESNHDDAIMTCIVMSTIFSMISYRDMVDDFVNKNSIEIDDEISEFVNEYDNDSPDLTTIVGGYKKVYNNPNKKRFNPNVNKRFTPENPLSKFPSKNRF